MAVQKMRMWHTETEKAIFKSNPPPDRDLSDPHVDARLNGNVCGDAKIRCGPQGESSGEHHDEILSHQMTRQYSPISSTYRG